MPLKLTQIWVLVLPRPPDPHKPKRLRVFQRQHLLIEFCSHFKHCFQTLLKVAKTYHDLSDLSLLPVWGDVKWFQHDEICLVLEWSTESFGLRFARLSSPSVDGVAFYRTSVICLAVQLSFPFHAVDGADSPTPTFFTKCQCSTLPRQTQFSLWFDTNVSKKSRVPIKSLSFQWNLIQNPITKAFLAYAVDVGHD